MRCLWIMFATAVCVLFLLMLKWPKNKNIYQVPVFVNFMVKTLIVIYHSLRPISPRKFAHLHHNFEMKTSGLSYPRKLTQFSSIWILAESTILNTWSVQVLALGVRGPLSMFGSIPHHLFWCYVWVSLSTLNKTQDATYLSPESDCWYNCTYAKINAARFFDLQIIIVFSISVHEGTSLFVVTHYLVRFWR